MYSRWLPHPCRTCRGVHDSTFKEIVPSLQDDFIQVQLQAILTKSFFPCFQACTIDGYHIPAGHAVVFMTQHAQRDPAVFKDPDTFMPSRWSAENKTERNKLFLFGGGPRCCIGQHMVWHILKVRIHLYMWTIQLSGSPC